MNVKQIINQTFGSSADETVEFCTKLSIVYNKNKQAYDNYLFYALRKDTMYNFDYLSPAPQVMQAPKKEEKCPVVQQEQSESINYCQYISIDRYEALSVNEQISSLLDDYKLLSSQALKSYDSSASKSNVEKEQKYFPILAFINFSFTYGAKYKNILPQDEIDSINAESEKTNQIAYDFIQDLALRYWMDQQKLADIINRTCSQQQPNQSTKSYVLLSSDERNQTVLQNSINLLKIAVESIIANKQELYKVYEQRKSDSEFLNVYSFVPVLVYVKYIEDNKDVLNQIDPLIQQDVLNKTLLNFTTDPKYYVQDLHAQVFILIGSNLYTLNPSGVNKAIQFS